ncbi:ribosome biosynthesis protein [Saccharomycopsis crataegensis]|uniref:Glutamate-rich WD repeat-containing protein 1 n=1 Tax=Saccharomycopsis crataegensis TaxID=43959 RepID=A0AAV5QU13_9ASCO|nr:ribosome biosynthesis protein [Saccharomycopsis crataegensis]
MAKRPAEEDNQGKQAAAKTDANSVPKNVVIEEEDVEMGEFEDPYGDEFESDGEIIEINSDTEEGGDGSKAAGDIEKDDQMEGTLEESTLYLPHRSRPLGADEVLEADPSVYEMLHNVNLPWSCLTVDVMPDALGDERRGFPAAMSVLTATQAPKAKDNELIMMKLTQLAKTLVNDDEEDQNEDDEDQYEGDPVMESETIGVRDVTNRLRVSPHAAKTGEYFTATMMESGDCCIYDLSPQFKSLNSPGHIVPKNAKKPIYTVRAHGNVEGYGLDWSPTVDTGALLSGDVSGRIFLTKRTSSNWVTDNTPFTYNNQSIEDIQWSKTEKTVFATGGCDGYVRIWDTRSKKHKPSINVIASESDVNVISWSSKVDYLLASGHDDGTWGIWDLRNFQPNKEKVTPVALYNFHKAPVTSISFNPLDESIIAVGSEDNTVTLWDLAVEADDEEIKQQKHDIKEMEDIPPQLLFVHWQKDVKEVQWHKQIPGALVSTGKDGLNIWKTISV